MAMSTYVVAICSYIDPKIVNDSELNRESTQNRMFFYWVMSWIESYILEPPERFLNPDSFFEKMIESWVESTTV